MVVLLADGRLGISKMILLLSILVPVSLLTVVILTGVINHGQGIAETTTETLLCWNFERPTADLAIHDCINTTFSTDELLLNQSILIGSYQYNSAHCGDYNAFEFTFVLDADAPQGHVHDITLSFYENYTGPVFGFNLNYFLRLKGLSLDKYMTNSTGTRTLLKLAGTHASNSVHCWWGTWWALVSPWNETHRTLITSEVTYFNGSVYKKLVQPVQITFGHDNDDSFEQAEPIGLGTRQDYVTTDVSKDDDPRDFFKIWLESGQQVKVALTKPEGARAELFDGTYWGIQMYIYNPDKHLEAFVQDANATVPMTVKAENAGWWYIEVTSHGGIHMYWLTLVAG